MVELCGICGQRTCRCHEAAPAAPPVGLQLDLDRPPPPASAPRPAAVAPLPPPAPRAPLPPPPDVGPPSIAWKGALVGLVAVVLGIGLWLGVRHARTSAEEAVDDAVKRAYPAPNRLVIAAVRSDYASGVLDDGSIFLQHAPAGSTAGLAAWHASVGAPGPRFVEEAILAMKEAPTYRALEAPAERCRSDAETASTTLGEVTFGDGRKVTLWTCTMKKRKHTYLLAWAALSPEVEKDETKLVGMLKASQLVSDDLCSLNVINGGCHPSAASLLEKLVTSAGR